MPRVADCPRRQRAHERVPGAGGRCFRAFTGLVYVFVCLKAWAGAFGVGSIAQYVGAVTALSGGLSDLVSALGSMRNNAAFLRTTFEFLDIPNEMYRGSLPVEKRAFCEKGDNEYEIEFRNVGFFNTRAAANGRCGMFH
ncbi:MAG: hypothetical protein ACLSB9_14695 [Hydrogeniiclostridium mannosilyticum]